MAFEIFQLFGSVFVDTSAANSEMDKTGTKAEALAKKFGDAAERASKLGSNLSSAGNAMTKGITVPVAAAVTGLGALIAKSVGTADEIQRLSDVSGMSSEQLQKLQYAGSALGVELDTITGAQAKLTKSMSAASDGTGSQADAFAALGISVLDSNGNMRDANTVMMEAFDALNGVGNETERDALSMALFGKSAMELNPLIKAGSAGLKELTDEASKNGAVMSNEAIAGLDTFGDTIDAIKLSIMGTVGTMAAQFVPGLQSLAQLFQENVLPAIAGFVGKIGDLATGFMELDPIAQTIIGTLVGLAVAAGPLLIVGGKIATGVSSIMTVFQGLAPVIAGATTSTTGLGTVLGALTGPIGLTIAAIAAIGAVIAGAWQNSETFRTSVGTAFESIKTTISEAFVKISEAMAPALEAFQGFAVNMQPVLQQIGDFLGIYIVPLVQQFIESFINGFANIIVAIAPFIEGIANLFNFIGNFVGAVFALFTGDWDSAWKFAQGMAQAAVDFLGNIVEGLKNLFILIFGDIIIDIQAKWMTFQVYTTAIWNDVVTFLQTTCQAIYDNTIGKIIELVTTLANKWEETKTDTQQKWNDIKADLAQKWEDIKTNVSNKVQEVATNVANKWQETKDDSSTKWGDIVTDLTAKAGEIFTNVVNKVREIVEDLPGKWQEIKENASTKWNEIKETIVTTVTELPGKIYQAAKDMLTEMVRGIQETAGDVYGAVTGLVNDVLAKFKAGFGIASPSKEMLSIGKYLMQGLIKGLNGDNLMAFVNKMVEDIKAAFAAGNFNLKAAIDFVGSGAMEFFKSIGIGGADFGSLVAPAGGPITSWFGYRDDVGDVGSSYHQGIDIGAGEGTPIGAAGAGTVTQAGWNGGYGYSVIIDHGNGLETLYGHMSEVLVAVGDIVSQLQTIGLVGSTGNSTGPHLHFSVIKDGEQVDPASIFGYASGTRSAKAGIRWVGEKGPELVGFNGGEAVLNARDSAALAGAGGINQTINIYSPTALSPAKNAKYVKRSLQELLMN